MKPNKFAVKVLIVILLMVQMGCSRTLNIPSEERKVIGAVLKTMDAEYWMELRSGMEQAAEETGVRLIVQWPSDETQISEQEVITRDMIEQDIDALLYAPCDSRQTAWLHELALEYDIPVLAIDTGCADSDIPYIGSNNREIGHIAYTYLLDQLDTGSSVGIIAGDNVQQSISDRVTGLRFYCERDNTLILKEAAYGCKNYSDAYFAARRMIEDQDISAIFCTSAVLGLGAAGARDELGQENVRIVCVDTQEDALRSLRTDKIDAIITQSGYDIGYQAVEMAAYHTGELLPGERYFTQNELITKDNIDEYLKDGGMQSDKGTAGG